MTVQKTVLAAVLLLLLLALTADATRATVDSTGPYDYYPWSTRHVYLLWFPPHAVPMNLTFLNVTWWKPEAIWFVGKYPVRVCGGECRYELATIYVVQDGVRMDLFRVRRPRVIAEFIGWHIENNYCALGIAMVAPNKIIVLNPTTQIWISDIYCLYNNNWFWLRLLPYIFDDLIVEGVEAVEFRDPKIYVKVPAKPPGDYVIPGGWYLDPATKRVFRIPSNDTAVMAELQMLRMRVSELEAELANKTARLAQLNATLIQLNATIAWLNVALAEARSAPVRLAAENQRLRAQLEELNATRIRLEAEVEAYRSQLEALRSANDVIAAQLARLTAENQALKAQIASMNETLAKLNEAYTSKLRSEIETWTRAAWIGAALGAAAGVAATTLALRRRK
jgi:cell division protein FtsB